MRRTEPGLDQDWTRTNPDKQVSVGKRQRTRRGNSGSREGTAWGRRFHAGHLFTSVVKILRTPYCESKEQVASMDGELD